MKRLCLIISSIALVLIPARADADLILTPFAGVTFGGDAPSSNFNWGGNVTVMGAVVGIELDFGYTANFFNQENGTAVIADSNAVTLMGNLIVGVGRGPFRPYVTGGLGLLRSDVEAGDLFDTNSVNDFGFNFGGGLFMFFTDRFGIRGDVRYFRTLLDPDDDNDLDVFLGSLDFWRATGGVSFKF